jgi:lipopolysaccharide transport system ATP-binding protein
MGKDIAIKIDRVSKKYCKSLKRSMIYGIADIGRNVCGLSSRSHKLRKNEFWAVDDVSLEIRKGETVGLIGQNGSGKTTLLKLINGIFWPDKGSVTVNGRVGALIAVGAGFHPMLTGRENIYVNGAILGMKKKEISKKFDAIVDFADIGDFLDSPVKNYSSGMYVRLGFSVAVHCEPDILLVDEVLAVGDVNFQHKCLRKMADILKTCAVVMVSHNAEVVRFICDRVLFLDHGKTQFLGPASEGIDKYIDHMMRKSLPQRVTSGEGSEYDAKVKVEKVRTTGSSQEEIGEIFYGESLMVECEFSAVVPISRVILGIAFYLDARERSFICYSSQKGKYFDLDKGRYMFRAVIPELRLKKGIYHLAVIIAEKNELASHTWSCPAYIVVKNPNPQYGYYDMDFNFELDNTLIREKE